MPDIVVPPPKPDMPLPDFSYQFEPTRLGTATFERSDIIDKGPVGNGTFVIACADEPGMVYGINDDRHVAIIASPRAGKTAGPLMMNAISHRGSLVVLDIKGEIASVTARVRAGGSIYTRGRWQRVVILDPFGIAGRDDDQLDDLRGFINPLDAIDPDDPEGLDDAFQLADALCPEDSTGKSDPFFHLSARTLVLLVILHVLTGRDFADEDRTLLTVERLLSGGDCESAEFWKGLEPDKPPSPYKLLFEAMAANNAFNGRIAMAGARFASLYAEAPKQFFGQLEIANRNLEFLQGKGMQGLFSHSSFDLRDLKGDPDGLSIYLCLPPRFLATHHGFFRSVITMVIRQLERDIRPPACGSPVLMLLDEFPALKRMPVIENALAQIAGYGVRMVFAAQTLSQLKDIYKDNWETFMGAVGLKLFFGNEDNFTREYVSKLIGETEIEVLGENASHARSSSRAEGCNRSVARGTNSSIAIGSVRSEGSGSSHGPALNQTSLSRNQTTSHSVQFTTGESRTVTDGDSVTETNGETVSDGRQITRQARPLARMDEVGRIGARIDDKDHPLFPGLAFVLLSGENPVLIRRSLYYREAMYQGWYDPHPSYRYPPILAARLDQEIAKLKGKVTSVETAAKAHADAIEIEFQQASRNALISARREVANAHASKLARQHRALTTDRDFKDAMRQQTRLERLDRLVGWLPVLFILLMLMMSFVGYFGVRLVHAETFTPGALWRAILGFPLFEPARWGGYMLAGMGVFGVISMVLFRQWLKVEKEEVKKKLETKPVAWRLKR